MRRALGIALLPLCVAPVIAFGPAALRAERRAYDARFSSAHHHPAARGER
jgi:hypothetical protein